MYTYNEPSPLMPPAATATGAFGESAGSPVDTEATDIHQNNSDDPNDASLMSDDVVVSIRKRSPSLLAVTAQEINSLFSEQAPLPEHSMFKDGRPPIGLLKGGATSQTNIGMGMRDSLAGASDLASSVQSHHGGGGGNNANILSNNPSMYSETSEAFQNQNRTGVATTAMVSGEASGGGCPQNDAIQTALNDIDDTRRDTSPATTTNITAYATALQPFNQLYHHHRKHKKASVFHFDPSPAPLPFPSLAPLLYSTIDSTIEEIQRCIETLDRVPLWDSQKMPHSELTSTLQHVRSLRAGWRESMEKKLGVLWLHVSDRYGIYSNRMDVALRRRHLLEVEAAFSLKGAGGAGLNSPNINDSTIGGGESSSAGGRVVSHVRAIPVDAAHLSGATPLERTIIIHLASLGVRWPGRGHDTSALVPVSYFSQEYDHDNDGTNLGGGGVKGGLSMTTSSAVNDGGRISLSRKGGGGGGILSAGGGVDRRRSESTMLEDALSKGMGGNSGDSLSGGGGGIVTSMSTGGGVSVNGSTISNGNNNNNNPVGGGGGNVSAAAAVELPPGYLRLTSGKIAAMGDLTAYGDINESLAHDARIKQRKVEEERRRQRAGLPPAIAEPAYNPRSAILREAMGLPALQTSPHNPSKRRFQTNDAAMALLASGSIRTPAMFKAAPPSATTSSLLTGNSNGGVHSPQQQQQQQQQQQPFSTTTPATTTPSSTSTEPLFQKLHLLAVKQLRERNLFNKTAQNHFEQLTAAKGNDTSLLGAKMAVAEDVLESVCEVVERKVSAALLLARTSDQHASSSHTTPAPNFLQRHASNMEKSNNNNARHRSSNGGNHVLSPTRGGGGGNVGSSGGQQAVSRRGNTATNSAVVASSSHHPHAPTKPVSSTTVTPKDIPLSNRRSVGGGGGGQGEEPLGTMINNNTPPRTAPGGPRPGGPPRGEQPPSSMPRPL